MPVGPLTFPRTETAGLYIPAEICDLICRIPDLTHHDLWTLSLVSRNFRSEAQRLLYSSLEIRGYDKLVAFCTAVIRYHHLVERTRKLVLFLPLLERVPNVYPADIFRIVKMLRILKNLKDLRIFPIIPEHKWKSQQTYILEGHTFKLTTFVNTYFRYVDNFVQTQPELVTLGIQEIQALWYWHWDPFADSNSLYCSIQTLTDIHHPRPERVHFISLRGRPIDHYLYTHFNYECESVKSLRVTNEYMDTERLPEWSIKSIVTNIAISSPNIKFLQIIDRTKTTTVSNSSCFPLTVSFPQIETLILCPPTVRSEDLSTTLNISSWPDLETNEGRVSAAMGIMEALPTLKRLVLVIRSLDYEYTRTASTVLGLCEKMVTLNEDEWFQIEL